MKSSYKLYIKDIEKAHSLSKAEQYVLIEESRKGNEKAKNILIKSCTKFVISLAHKYKNQGVDVEDLIGAGNMGLMIALDNFNLDKKVNFLTFAVHWIKQQMLNELDTLSRSVRIHNVIATNKRKVDNSIKTLTQKLHREPTIHEIHDDCKVSYKEINRQIYLDQVSLDSDEEDNNLHNILEDKRHSNYDDTEEKVLNFLDSSNLNDKEKDILKLSYGIETYKSHKLEDISEKYGQTKQRIQQVREEVLNSLHTLNDKNKKNNKIHFTELELA